MARSTESATVKPEPKPPPAPKRRGWRFGLLLVVVVLAYWYGWQVTKIDFPGLVVGLPKMQHIAFALVRPLLFERVVDVTAVEAPLAVGEPGPEIVTRGDHVQLSAWPGAPRPGDILTVEGSGYPAGRAGKLEFVDRYDLTRPAGEFKTDADGHFVAAFTVPSVPIGAYKVRASIAIEQAWWLWKPTETLALVVDKMVETIFLALMGTTFGLVLTLPLSFLGARNLMTGSRLAETIYFATRTLFNILRSVEVMIFAVIMAVVVGIGPFAGVMAIVVHSIGALGKLYSEAIESIDPGPLEAIAATGASRLQVILFGVVPQVLPQFVAFTIYRWDINVRMSTIIGFVGGGGVGYLLIQYINLLQWQEAATAIWLIAIAVMVMDYTSAIIRERLV